MNAVLLPFVNRSDTSVLNLTLAATFVSAPPWISFLFESTFRMTETYNASGSGNGQGIWKIFRWHTYTGQNITRIQFLFNRTDFSSSAASQGTTFTQPEISLSVTGVPYISKTGGYVVIFPFSYQGMAGAPVTEGSFTVCPPAGFILTNANEPSKPLSLCQGTLSSHINSQ